MRREMRRDKKDVKKRGEETSETRGFGGKEEQWTSRERRYGHSSYS